jgi:molybdopterin molybdotransferase
MSKDTCTVKKTFITYDESIEILNNLTLKEKNTKKLFISDALGYILAQDIVAKHNSPEFPTSAMDGYAFKYEDINLGSLQIIDYNPAGSIVSSEVVAGTCIKTFTGSLMPKGSDTLIPIENVTVQDDMIIINEEVPFAYATRKVGENYAKDEVLIKKGSKIDFAQIGVMASLNIIQVEVYEKTTITVASTGSEILDLGDTQINDSQIRSSNHLTLEAIAKKYGANVNQKGVVKDDKQSILNLIKNSLDSSDIVVTTGGVSVGDYDFVKDIIKDELGATVLFQGVLIKPGQHIIVAKKDNKFIVGLPGFAYSSTVTFILYVLPLLFKLQSSKEKLKIVEANIKSSFSKKGNKTTFTAVNLTLSDGQYYCDFDGKKNGTSAILTNLLGNSGLLICSQGEQSYTMGDKVKVLKI